MQTPTILQFMHEGQLQEISEGLYFGMPDSVYHKIPALSSTFMKNISISPPDAFFNCSWLNPNYDEDAEDEDSKEWRKFGKAAHTRVLEGKKVFDALYCVEFIAPEGCLDTKSDLQAYCDNNWVTYKKSWAKPLFIDAIRLSGNSPLIYDIEKERYFRETSGRIQLTQKDMRRIEIAAAMIENHPELKNCFKGGYPEVSVVWIENGIWFKARFDYLKPAAIVDLKTFTNMSNRNIDVAVHHAFANMKYHMQAVHYTHAARKAAQFAGAGITTTYGVDRFGPSPEFLKMLATATEEHEFFLVFQKKGGAPLARGKKFKVGSLMHDKGTEAIQNALVLFRQYHEHFGNGIWVDQTPITDFQDELFPRSAMEF